MYIKALIRHLTSLAFIISILASTFLMCSLFDKDVNCRAKLFLKVINTASLPKRVEFTNFKESYKPDYVTITFSDSSASMEPKECSTFLFEYSRIGNNECFFSDVFFEDYRIDVTIKDGDSVAATYQVYPFDTTKKFQSLCTNCVHEYRDSLVLK